MESGFKELFKETDHRVVFKKLAKWLTKYGGHAPHQYLIEDLFHRVEYDELYIVITDLFYSATYEPLRKSFGVQTP